jgi:uncharacterized membrane protein
MHLQEAPTPYSPILLVHISAGIVGLLSGTATMIFRKGSRRHARAGRVFVVSMLTMAGVAVYIATVRHEPGNIGGGILTFYLIGTAWLTAKREDGVTSRFDWVVLLIPLALGILNWMNGLAIVRRGVDSPDGVPVGITFFMGSVMLLAATGDVRMLVGGGISEILRTSVPDSLASLVIGLLLAVTAFGLARPFADFLVGRSVPPPLFEQLQAIVQEDQAVERILSLRAIYSGPEEVIVAAKVHPSANMNIEKLTRAMDDLDQKIRLALPFVADVFIDITASRTE